METIQEKFPPPVFEQGPIRPPSEAYSLLLRVTRNCPWNQCAFCPVYKGQEFARRSVEDVKADIKAMQYWADYAKELSWKLGLKGEISESNAGSIYARDPDNPYLRSILLWMIGGRKTAFLQDADSLIIKTENLADILRTLRETFPGIERVTSYARSSTLARKSVEELKMLNDAGLNRIHVGLESGSDNVLKLVRKGATAEKHILAGRNVKQAGIELSEYVMPGLGGKGLSEEHAKETALVLNQINPDFIRIRSLAVPSTAPLYELLQAGEFCQPSDLEIAQELRIFIQHLEGINSYIVSDHVLNLFQEIEGSLPAEKARFLETIDRFLDMNEQDQMVYIIGRRLGLFNKLDDLADSSSALHARNTLERLKVTNHEELNKVIQQLVSRFI